MYDTKQASPNVHQQDSKVMAKLPAVSAEKIKAAFIEFDTTLRDLPEWNDWESKSVQYFAVAFEGMRYPPKKIISLATGAPLTAFSGGYQSNSFLKKLGFEVVNLRDLGEGIPAPSFEIGRTYDRRSEINGPFGGSHQSGISKSLQSAAVFLFTGESGAQFGYEDHFDDHGVFWYTGEGQKGDMKLDKGNRAIAEHAKEGRALHVFKTLGKSKGQEYLGEFSYASHAFRDGPDITGSQRKTIVFHLVPVGRLSEVADDPDDTEGQVEAISLEEARRRALAAFEPTVQAGTALVWRSIHKRSKAVREYVLMRSSGRCESCHEPAPSCAEMAPPIWSPITRRESQMVGSIIPDTSAQSVPLATARFTSESRVNPRTLN